MRPLDTLTFAWPDTAVVIAVTLVSAVVVRMIVGYAIGKGVDTMIARARKHSESTARTDRIVARATGAAHERFGQRAETLASLLRNIANVLIVVVAVLTIMSAIGLPLGPALASAGVGGVALAFGAQSLVKDFLSGLFMIAEDQYGVGDLVTINDISGTVEEVGLRVTRIREPGGTVWYFRNGELLQVGNQSQGWSTAMVDVPVAYNEDPERVARLLTQVVDELDASDQWDDVLLEKPSVLGVESISGGTMTMRILLKTKTNQQWGVQRDLRERAKSALDAAGVRGPQILPGGGSTTAP